MPNDHGRDGAGNMIDAVIRFCLENKLVMLLILAATIGWAMMVMPFDYPSGMIPRDPVPVDAIPDIGENQQIVFTAWPGRSPQDVEDQITYPLTVSLLGVPGVKTIRSYSFLGFSSVYVVFEESVDFYWARSRILERLSVAQKELPEGVTPALGPDATALGQVFWYTLEGLDPSSGEPVGGWDLDELRSIQDWHVRYALQAAEGVSEVASVGGFVREYQIDVDPDAMRAHGVTLHDVYNAVRKSNIDVGARTIEINRVEYVIRALGFVRTVADLENTVVKSNDNVPVYLKNVAHVSTGPALRRGALDKGGAEAVGGVVVVRYGENPLAVIKNVQKKIEEIGPGLPQKTLSDGRVSRVTIVPFYDRTELIHETLGTLENALTEEILVTIIVVIAMVMHLRSSALVSALLPLAVMMAFIAMKVVGVDSNIMSLSGIAIAIGTMVDMGIILCENILRHLDEAKSDESRLEVIFRAASEVGRPVVTAILTTVVSFLPVFAMIGAEGKLFRPLAFTKTFALLASVIVALTLIPPIAHVLFSVRVDRRWVRRALAAVLLVSGIGVAWWTGAMLIGAALAIWAVHLALGDYVPPRAAAWAPRAANVAALLLVLFILAEHWTPLGPEKGLTRNVVFVGTMIGSLLGAFLLFLRFYESILRFFLAHKLVFYTMPLASVLLGLSVWLGFDSVFGFIPWTTSKVGIPERVVRGNPLWAWAAHEFPGLGKEFMPELDEGSYLLMPTTMPHASIGEAMDILSKQDMAISAIPEMETAVGKIGRVDSPLDPAPISMIETIINYHPEFLIDENNRRRTFAFEASQNDLFRDTDGNPLHAPDGEPYLVRGKFLRDKKGKLIPDARGMVFRQWRPALDPQLNPGREAWPGVTKPDDIWDLIVKASAVPGTTSAPRLQPIAARIVMLQTGVRAPMAVRILGDDLEEIEQVGLAIEKALKEVPGIEPATVVADRIVGKPYLEIDIDRNAIARYGINIRDVQDVIETAIGGRGITTTIEGRERYPVRVRYQRELRDTIESLGKILVASPGGTQVPLGELAEIRYLRGPQVIKSEDTRLVGYVVFDKKPGYAEVDVVQQARDYLNERIASGQLALPPGTARPTFIGSYENQVRSMKTLTMVAPLALFLIFIILYLQFRSVSTTLLIFAGVFIACSGGFIMLWFYSTDWFLNFSVFGVEMRTLFQVHPINLSVAVWVGFIALLGIATDDGVLVGSYLEESFRERRTRTKKEIRELTVRAGLRRIRPCLMTTATTILALIPVLTSTGRGADVMVPMAIPSFGGMTIELMTLFFVPVTYCLIQEWKAKLGSAPTGLVPVER
jgi:Cu(I)/Ag(I) efflux system membrane protein CusA/SilA